MEAEFETVMMKGEEVEAAVGVPLIAPATGSKVKPAGNEGLDENTKEEEGPPFTDDGEKVVILVPEVKVIVEAE